MNPDFIKEQIKKNINKPVIITVYGMRNKINTFEGTINKVYPNIFTIIERDIEKSFSYADIITGDIKIKYK